MTTGLAHSVQVRLVQHAKTLGIDPTVVQGAVRRADHHRSGPSRELDAGQCLAVEAVAAPLAFSIATSMKTTGRTSEAIRPRA